MNWEPFYFPIAMSLHGLAAMVWVGGMFFAYFALRPVAAKLFEPAIRLRLWDRTLMRFFIWVWLAVFVLPATGYWMMLKHLGGLSAVGWHIHVMQVLGIVMILIFLHVFFAPFMRLRKAVKHEDIESGTRNLAQIRKFIGINLLLGIAVLITALGLEHIPV